MKRDINFSLRQISSVVIPILLSITGILGIFWIITGHDFEPLITLMLILVGFLGIFIDRWIRLRETRKSLLYALVHELFINMQVLADSRFNPNPEEAKSFVIFPRLSNTVVDVTITSNTFASKKDRELFRLLHSWRELSKDFNKRLDITEIAILNQSPTTIKLWRDRLKDGVTISQIRKSLFEISNHLLKFYKKESGIDENTILFGE